jgi:transcriptional regulator GlxA family with amidase domain
MKIGVLEDLLQATIKTAFSLANLTLVNLQHRLFSRLFNQSNKFSLFSQ